MKKIVLTLTLIVSLICCQLTTFARTYTIGNSGFAQESDIVILQQRLNWDKPNAVVLGLPENGGPMLDDEHTLLMTIYIASEWGYDVTEKNGTITVSHEKREITIPLNENKATVDGKTIDLFHTQQNDTIYIPYKSLTDLFDVDVSWDADDLCLLITEKETSPISEKQLEFRKHLYDPNSVPNDTDMENLIVLNSVCDENGGIITINDKPIDCGDAQPFIDENDCTQAPVRAVAEAFGFNVQWNEAEQTVIIAKDEMSAKLTINSNKFEINGKAEEMDTTARIVNDRTYIPIRSIACLYNDSGIPFKTTWSRPEKAV